MSKKKKSALSKADGLIPELRFPEFKNEGEWEEKELDYSLDYLQPTPYLVESTDYNDKYKTPVLTAGKSFILGYTNEDKGIFKNNLPVIIFDDFTTATQFVDFPFKGKSSAMKILKAKKDADIKFLFESMQLIKYEVGVHQRHWISIFSKLKIPAPKLNEQQKIASCLSSLDEVIANHSQKLELLKDHKKGLMQNLFPTNSITNDQLRITEDNDQFVIRNSQTRNLPKVRFKEFEKNGEWVEKKLGDKDVAFIVNEKTSISKLNIETYISTENMLPDFTGVSAASKLPPTGSFTKFKIGDILISNIRPYLKKVWKSDKIGGASNDVIVFRSSSGVLSEFLEFLIKNETFINYVMESAKGVKMPRGDKDSMLNYPVFIPTKEEQIKIGSCLSSLDEIITSQTEKIEQLKHHKKGLMQGLFPKMIDI
ncbi:MAG: hypothetical protein GW809_08200 [Bacteroidetes bacterium]|nr:hypothetical protein [Bacteroidota bacterium]